MWGAGLPKLGGWLKGLDKISLDMESFKALASEQRVELLKRLDKRRMTLSDMAQTLGLSPSTVKEHLDKLVAAKLVEQLDEGRKWKYYTLTRKGRAVLHPERTRIWITLVVSLLAFSGGFYKVFSIYTKAKQLPMERTDIMAKGVSRAFEEAVQPVMLAQQPAAQQLFPWFLLILAGVLGVAISLYLLSRKSRTYLFV